MEHLKEYSTDFEQGFKYLLLACVCVGGAMNSVMSEGSHQACRGSHG